MVRYFVRVFEEGRNSKDLMIDFVKAQDEIKFLKDQAKRDYVKY